MSHRSSLLRHGLIVALAAAAGQSPVAGQAGAAVSAGARWARAVDAWEAGSYPVALEDLRTLMTSPAAADYLERVALLTGELYVTTEITPDGREPELSRDGRYLSYVTGASFAPTTRIVRLAGGRIDEAAELKGLQAAFDLAGTQVAYLRIPSTPEWQRANEELVEARTQQQRQAAQSVVNFVLGKGDLVVRNLSSGTERVLATGSIIKSRPLFSADGQAVLFIGAEEKDLTLSDVYIARDSGAPERLTSEPGFKTNVMLDPSGKAVVYQVSATVPFRNPPTRPATGRGAGTPTAGRGGAGRGAGPNPCGSGGATPFGVVNLADRTTRTISAHSLTMSADGATLAWLVRSGDGCALRMSPTLTDRPAVVRTTAPRQRLNSPALSPDGRFVAYELMTHTDWEIYISDSTGAHRRLTRDIQHDVLPHFLDNTTVLGMMGEPRHRRSHVYDLATGTRRRLFANNTVRTVSPEYVWAPSADGRFVAIQADRDGDTISTERGVYVVDLDRKVTAADLIARIDRQAAAERDLRQRMTAAYRPVADLVKKVLARASVTRVWQHARALFEFDSKHISQPGNARAIEYLTQAYASFGYEPEQQWFAQANALGGKTANVIATLRGTENPELIYVVSSHFDSVAGGPGADDDTSGTTALLEAARILAGTPQPATIVFASFTGEEAGLLGSREFVRRAAVAKWRVVGALNNDMIGWAGESARMDNTIRYSNTGIRDLQHGAAFQFTDLILYDAKYYRGTDAAAFFEAWGDIVGGIGSYPILANPNYHQPTDYLDTINQRQVTETAKVTAATLIYLASSPSRLKDLKAGRTASGVEVTWTPSPESGIKQYVVAYGPAADPLRTRITVAAPKATLPALPAGTQIAVKAINSRGLEGWDWARTVLQ